MELIVTTKADLKALLDEQAEQLKAEFREMLESLKNENSTKTDNEYMSIDETCKMLKIDRSTLHRWTNLKRVKNYKIQGKVYYKRSEMERAMI